MSSDAWLLFVQKQVFMFRTLPGAKKFNTDDDELEGHDPGGSLAECILSRFWLWLSPFEKEAFFTVNVFRADPKIMIPFIKEAKSKTKWMYNISIKEHLKIVF